MLRTVAITFPAHDSVDAKLQNRNQLGRGTITFWEASKVNVTLWHQARHPCALTPGASNLEAEHDMFRHMYIYIYARICSYIERSGMSEYARIHIHMHVHTYIHTYIQACMHTLHTHIHVCIYTYTYIYMYVCMCVCVYLTTYLCTCMFMLVG